MMQREAIYAKAEFSEEDGLRSAELESRFAEMNGYEAESEAAVLLSGLGISEELRTKKMRELEAGDKVRVLWHRLFSAIPDVLLLATTQTCYQIIRWLEEFLSRLPIPLFVVSMTVTF